MVQKSIRPEDILSEEENYKVISGIRVRKGSIGAALKNASILASTLASSTEKEEARRVLAELAPALVALGMHEHVIWKNPEIQKQIEAAAKKLQKK
jgi:hypothetical protein